MNYLGTHIEKRLIFPIILLFFLTGGPVRAQETKTKPTRQSSLEAYSSGDYERAYGEFSELLIAYPKDPLYLYYTGVCLVRLQKEPARAVSLLQQARQNTAQLRIVPPDASFWLGRAQQCSGNFEEAIASFEDYTVQAGKKTAREMLVPEYIDQCRQKKGALPVSAKTSETHVPPVPEVIKKEPETTAVRNNNTSSKVTDDLDKALSEALDYQAKADSLNKVLSEKEKQIDNLDYARKAEERAALTQEKKAADSLQTLALKKFEQAQKSVNSTSLVTGKPVVTQVSDTAGKTKTARQDPVIASPVKTEAEKTTRVNQPRGKGNAALPFSALAGLTDTIRPVPSAARTAVFSVFEIVNPPSLNDKKKIEIDPEIPGGLVYRIQVAVFRNPVVQSYFKGITPVFGFRVPAKDVTIYYAGMFRKMTDAGKALTSVRQKGFKDAFVTPFMEGKAVSQERAAALEKEWGNSPLFEIAAELPAPKDTIPPTLSFRVEVMRTAKPAKDDVIDGIKKVAGPRAIDTEKSADGSSIYLIGRFITYESADEYASLLIRNGYKDARVGAWLGKKEIPVETARQLFEKIE